MTSNILKEIEAALIQGEHSMSDDLKKAHDQLTEIRATAEELALAINSQAVFADEVLAFIEGLPEAQQEGRAAKAALNMAHSVAKTLQLSERSAWNISEAGGTAQDLIKKGASKDD